MWGPSVASLQNVQVCPRPLAASIGDKRLCASDALFAPGSVASTAARARGRAGRRKRLLGEDRAGDEAGENGQFVAARSQLQKQAKDLFGEIAGGSSGMLHILKTAIQKCEEKKVSMERLPTNPRTDVLAKIEALKVRVSKLITDLKDAEKDSLTTHEATIASCESDVQGLLTPFRDARKALNELVAQHNAEVQSARMVVQHIFGRLQKSCMERGFSELHASQFCQAVVAVEQGLQVARGAGRADVC